MGNDSRKLFGTLCILLAALLAPRLHAAETAWPGAQWERATPQAVGMDEAKLIQARDYALSGGGSGMITRHGKVVMTWGDPRERYDLKSSTKSFGSIALGLTLKDGKVALDDKARKYHPAFGEPCDLKAKAGSAAAPSGQQAAWMDAITIMNLATQTAGFEKPGGSNKLLFEPGSHWYYTDSGPNWLADCLTLAYHRDLDELMFERVFTPLGITREDLTWRKNSYRPEKLGGLMRREFGAGIFANVGALARVGLMMLREGQWNGREILTRDYARTSPRVPPGHAALRTWEGDPHGTAASHYGMLWWNNDDGTIEELPRDAFWSWGLYDSFILVIPSLDIVASRAGKSWARKENANPYDVLKGFFVPIAQSVHAATPPETAGGWRKYEGNPVMGGKYGTCFDLCVLREEGKYRMWLSWRPKKAVAVVESADGIHWSEPPRIVLGPRPETGWEDDINRPVVLKQGGTYHMWYTGQAKGHSAIGYATSPDGVTWKRMSARPVLSPEKPWEKVAVMCPHVLWDAEMKQYRMWYSGGEQNEPNAIGHATSPDGLAWTKHAANPVFTPDPRHDWEKHKVTACQVERRGDGFVMFYIGFRDEPHAQIGLARSRDGISNWERHPANPIIRPGLERWDHDACYKPFALFDGAKWLLWYNGRHGHLEQIGVAIHDGEDLGW